MRLFATALILATTIVAASAQVSTTEVVPTADRELAIEAGYEIVQPLDRKDLPEREYVNETFMHPIFDAYGKPGLPYGFGYIWRDLTGDGQEDLILVPKMAGLYPPEEYLGDPGAAVFVYVRTQDGAWKLEIEAGMMVTALRSGENGSTDIAFVQQDHMDEFFWNGEEFVKRARR